LSNILSPIFDIECFTIEPAAGADLAANKRGRKEIHLQLDSARTFAFGAAPLRAVKGKAARRIAAQPSLGNLGKKLADIVEEADIGGGIERGVRPMGD